MNILLLKTGDIFFYDSYTAHDGKTHHHRCRVLFIGTEYLFYDTWWESLNEWAFVPVKKRLTYYRFPLAVLPRLTNLTFNGFEAIDKKSADKLFLQSPEILLKVVKDEIQKELDNTNLMDIHSDIIGIKLKSWGMLIKHIV